MPADVKFLTIDDVSEMLQVTRTTVYNLKKQGMPFIKLGKNIRFDQKEVIDWVRSNSHSAAKDKQRGNINDCMRMAVCLEFIFNRRFGFYIVILFLMSAFLIKKALNSYEEQNFADERLQFGVLFIYRHIECR